MARKAQLLRKSGGKEKSRNPGKETGKQRAVPSSRRKTLPALPDSRHECLIIGSEGSCEDWQEILADYPMIDSVQREDFPEHGASFVYLAHFYRTADMAKENTCAQKQFRQFFQSIGYTFDSAGTFKSRWFEGIGVRTG
ncbi:MAG TPA: hypothetical protein P5217_03555 [Methanoregulaceae archaeon]|nr:hypothetical protein [Methanoregulaceae archaeon]HPD75792.1 hypothetical protein [Methanoregulaceae archaeon]HRY75337.1 hypothetical protein [Methanoregulaceae archaeon]